MDEIIRSHIPCPDCGSSDGMTEYADHTYCFVCEKYTPLERAREVHSKRHKKLPLIRDDLEYKDLRARGIMQKTCIKYGYAVTKNEFKRTVQIAPYYSDDGELLFQKERDKDKNFAIRGKKSYRFFGQHLFTSGKKLIVTEGEVDCLTVSQVQDNKYPVVSIPFGTGSAVKTFKENYEWLCRFDEVIVMFDMDKPGQEAVQKIGGILPPHKLKIAHLPLKDPNECLINGQADAIIKAIWRAAEYHPDGIINAADLKDTLFSNKGDIVSFSYPFMPKLNSMTEGMRKGEMVLLTAGTGIGKSTLARELAYKLKMEDKLKIGLVMLEENPKKTLRDILSIHMQKPLHLLWNNEDIKEKAKRAFDEVFGDKKFLLYDHFGSIEDNNLLDKIRYLIVGEECDFVVLDHVSIAVSGLDAGNDERKTIDRLMTNLRSLVEETQAGLIVISHLRKSENKSTPFEQGGVITLDDLRGSGSLKQIPDTIIALERNQQAEAEDKNNLKIRVLKCRFTGTTGLADKLTFNKSTNRLQEVDELSIERESEEEEQCPNF